MTEGRTRGEIQGSKAAIFGVAEAEETETTDATVLVKRKIVSRSSSASGKKRPRSNAIMIDDGFEARSRFNVVYPPHTRYLVSLETLAPFTMEAILERFRTSNTQQWALMSPLQRPTAELSRYDATRSPTTVCMDGSEFSIRVTVR